MEKRQLARESVERLQKFMAQIRNSTTVDLSTERLGDEGFAYIIDALSFNDRWGRVWLGGVGVGRHSLRFDAVLVAGGARAFLTSPTLPF